MEEEEEEVVVDDGDNEIPDDEGESDAARDVKNQNEEDNFVESGPKVLRSRFNILIKQACDQRTF